MKLSCFQERVQIKKTEGKANESRYLKTTVQFTAVITNTAVLDKHSLPHTSKNSAHLIICSAPFPELL